MSERHEGHEVVEHAEPPRRARESRDTVQDRTSDELGRGWRATFRRVDASAVSSADAGSAQSANETAGRLDYTAIIARFEGPLLRYVVPLLSNGRTSGDGAATSGGDAQDVVQETFIRLHRQVTDRGEASIEHLSSWLFRVAHNLARDVGRRRQTHGKAMHQVAVDARQRPTNGEEADPLSDLEVREAQQHAMAELHRLPEHLREVLLLKITQGMTLRQIADVTGLTLGNVGYRITQALQELSRRLKTAGVI